MGLCSELLAKISNSGFNVRIMVLGKIIVQDAQKRKYGDLIALIASKHLTALTSQTNPIITRNRPKIILLAKFHDHQFVISKLITS